VVDWSGGAFASCMPRVQLYVNECSGLPQFALQHHWLLPINCHFLRLYSATGRGIAAVSSAIEESDLYLLPLLLLRFLVIIRCVSFPVEVGFGEGARGISFLLNFLYYFYDTVTHTALFHQVGSQTQKTQKTNSNTQQKSKQTK